MNDLTHAYAPRPSADEFVFDVISDMGALRRIAPEWNALLAQDPDASLFLSPDWLTPGFEAHPGRWRVFVLRAASGTPLCILPVKYRLHWSTSRNQFQTEIEAGGRLAWGEYTGFVCHPDHESAALSAMATHVAALPWKTFSLRYEPTERRARLFAEALGAGFTYRFRDYRINKGTTDNLISPQVPLPANFDTLLGERISANTRQKIRRFRRKLLETGTYHITAATPETVESDIAQLLSHWVSRWQESKGLDPALEIAERYGRALLTAEAMGALYLPALWQGDRMLGALGHVVDARRGFVHFLVAGRDPAATDPAIGVLLHAHAIEWAIAEGHQTYDFSHGDEAYKFSFGPEAETSHYLNVRRDGAETVLDPSALGPALQRLADYAKAGQTKRVARGAAQLSALLNHPN